MTCGTLAEINVLAAGRGGSRWRLKQAQNPSHLIRIDVQKVRLRIEGSPTPFRSPIEAREYDRAFTTSRYKLPVTAELGKACERFLMGLRSPLRQHICRKLLTCERLRHDRKGLAFGSGFPLQVGL